MESNSTFQYLSQFLEKITQPEDKTPLAPIVAQMLKCPVAFVDESFHIMNSSCYDVDEQVWNRHLLSKQKQFWHAPKEYNENGFVIEQLKKPIGKYAYEVIFPIYQDNSAKTIEGVVYLLSPDQSLPEEYSEILRFISFSLSWVMWRHVRQGRNSLASQNHLLIRLLLDMLYGNNPTDSERQNVLDNCFFNVKQDFVLLVIEASASYDQNYSIEKLTNAVSTVFPESLTLCFSGDVMILLPLKYRTDPQYDRLWERLTSVLKKNNCYSGLSTSFYSIDNYFLNHFVRGLSAARAARETNDDKRIVSFTDFPLFNLISNGPPPFGLKALCDPSLLKLLDYDKKHKTDYYYTMLCYWNLDRDTPRVCKYMHIHKNTLYYRLSKIKSLLNREIDNHATIMELNLSISIMEYLGMVPIYQIRDEQSVKKESLYEGG